MASMVSIPLIILSCVFIALGRREGRFARRRGSRGRKIWGWALLAMGLVLMILGVLLW